MLPPFFPHKMYYMCAHIILLVHKIHTLPFLLIPICSLLSKLSHFACWQYI
jgi:hypothetical protein